MSEGVHGPVNGDEKAPRRGKLSARGDAAQWNVGDSARFHQTMPSRPYAGNSQICGGGNQAKGGSPFPSKATGRRSRTISIRPVHTNETAKGVLGFKCDSVLGPRKSMPASRSDSHCGPRTECGRSNA